MRRHTHDGDRLTFGCPACIRDADEARWTNAPVRAITFRAVVPLHVATNKGKTIEWRFTSHCQIPDNVNWRGDDELDYGRFDVGADMAETMPAGDYDMIDALATADLHITDVQPVDDPAIRTTQEAMF